MQTNNILTIHNIHSIKGTTIPTPNLVEKVVIWDIETSEYQYRVLITDNHNIVIVLLINRENVHYPGSLAKDVNSYICIMEHKYGYEIDEEKWVLETDDFKDKDTFIKIIGARAEELIFKRIMRQKKEAARMVTIPNHPPVSTLHNLKNSKNYKRIEPFGYTPKESKPNLTHKIKKIMQGLGQLPDYIIHKIQYYIRKIV